MRDGGRVAAALAVLEDFDRRRVPIKVAVADWARGARYAGSKDRAFVSGLSLDVLRRRSRLDALGHGLRGGLARTLAEWAFDRERIIAAFADTPHGPGALSEAELSVFDAPLSTDGADAASMPDFAFHELARCHPNPLAEALASQERAAVDMRVNTLRSDKDRAEKALTQFAVERSPYARDGLRLPADAAAFRAPNVTVTPAYQKGWIEIQDEGSQLTTLAAGAIIGRQVLDFCAGGGGKTLGLAALMENSGQIYAYDADASRLAPIFERLNRNGVRNAQVISPAEDAGALEKHRGQMDVVFVDAPCSGSGTWRRKPDTKWRLTPAQLQQRQTEQDEVLAAAASFVRPGGVMVYVTCSLFAAENEDRVRAFIEAHPEFSVDSVMDAMAETERVNAETLADLAPHVSESGTLYLSPHRTRTDGFGVTRLCRAAK